MPISLGSPLLLVFALGSVRCGLPAEGVERVLRAVEITRLPGAPEGVLGVIDVHGAALPVFDLGPRLGLPAAELRIEDSLVLVQTPRRRCAVLVNAVHGLQTAPGEALPLAPQLHGVAKTPDGLILLYDLDRFLSLEEDEVLRASLRASS